MELQFESSDLPCLRRAVREVQNQEQTLELRLSEGMPDSRRVLCIWGQVILRGKEWHSGEFSVSGGVQVSTLYVPEDGSDVRSAESWLPFRMRWDLPGESREGTIRVWPLLRFADARALSARKLMVRVGIAMLGEALVPDTLAIARPGEIPEQVHLLETTYPCNLMKWAGEKAFTLDETLSVSGSQPEKILYGYLRPELTECRISGNRLILRGNGNLHTLYRGEDGQLYAWDDTLPFSQLAELDQAYEDSARAEAAMAVTALELTLEAEGQLRLKCGMLAQFAVTGRELVTVVEDAYRIGAKAEVHQAPLDLELCLDDREISVNGEQTVHQQAENVVDGVFLPDFPRQRKQGDKAELELSGQFQVLYDTGDGTLQCATARWEGQQTVNAGEETALWAVPMVFGNPTADIRGDSLELRAEGKLDLQTMVRQEIPMVTGLTLADAEKPDDSRPSLILRRAGKERLWDIAKASGSTMAAIREANGPDTPRSEDQILLIPVY